MNVASGPQIPVRNIVAIRLDIVPHLPVGWERKSPKQKSLTTGKLPPESGPSPEATDPEALAEERRSELVDTL